MKEYIYTENAPEPIGPYSQAVTASGKLLFVSEQIPLNPKGEVVGDEIESQSRQVIANIKSIVEKAGGGLSSIVKTTVFLKNLSDFAKFNEVYNEYFSESKPARTAVEVSGIPKNVLIGMDAFAVLPE